MTIAQGEVLTALDDTLRHTSPTTFDRVATTDPRFFDRVWYCGIPPGDEPGVMFGIAAYANMNVMDGYVCVIDGAAQHNLRFSRHLRPDIDGTAVGPFELSIVEPLEHHAARLAANDAGIELDLEWRADAAPRLERPHQRVADGRVVQDYRRFGQTGRLSGTMRVGGRSVVADGWYSMRDHAWGVRRHVGGVEPYASVTDDFGGLFIWVQFSAGPYAGNLQIIEDADGTRRYLDGAVRIRGGETDRVVALEEADYDLAIPDGSRLFEHARFAAVGAGGERIVVDARPAHAPWVLRGSGYDHGFADRRGLGADRGATLIEHDIYHLLPSGLVRFPDGSVGDPWHREFASHVEIDGHRGSAHVVVLLEGEIARLGRAWPALGPAGVG